VTEPPSGHPPPATAELREGKTLDLRSLAVEICRRYRLEFPDERERYGDVGIAWCIHDNQHILNWAVTDLNGFGGLRSQLEWLAGVLHARDFPVSRLARNLELAADVVEPTHLGLSNTLTDAARFVGGGEGSPGSGRESGVR
jgi:hypothetical protein